MIWLIATDLHYYEVDRYQIFIDCVLTYQAEPHRWN